MHPLRPCPACARHVLAAERACPFCSHPLAVDATVVSQVPAGLGRAARMAFGAAVAATALAAGGCSGATSSTADAGVDAGSIAMPYGAPPRRSLV
jgi:hypothetical protein